MASHRSTDVNLEAEPRKHKTPPHLLRRHLNLIPQTLMKPLPIPIQLKPTARDRKNLHHHPLLPPLLPTLSRPDLVIIPVRLPLPHIRTDTLLHHLDLSIICLPYLTHIRDPREQISLIA